MDLCYTLLHPLFLHLLRLSRVSYLLAAFCVSLTISDVQDSYNLKKARWGVFHISVLKKLEQG